VENFNLSEMIPWADFNTAMRQAKSIKITVGGRDVGADCEFGLDDEDNLTIACAALKENKKDRKSK